MKTQISYYMNAYDVTSERTCDIDAILGLIKTGGKTNSDKVLRVRTITDSKLRMEEKMKLPVVLFSGVFSYRNDSSLVNISSFMVFDFDHFSSEVELQQAKSKLIGLDYIYSIFRSPSGDGLKAVVYTDNTNHDHYTNNYIQLLNYFGENVSDKVDTCTTNVSRACFISYDQDIYINTNPIPYHFVYDRDVELVRIDAGNGEVKYIRRTQTKTSGDFWNSNVELKWRTISIYVSDDDVIKFKDYCYKKYKSGYYIEGNRRRGLFAESCDLCRFGVHINNAKKYLIDEFTKVGLSEKDDDLENVIKNGYRSTIKDFGIKRNLVKPRYYKPTNHSKPIEIREKSYTIDDKKEENKNAYSKWTLDQEEQLRSYFTNGKTIIEIANMMGRNTGSIEARLKKIGIYL